MEHAEIQDAVRGRSAAEIAADLRALIERGELGPGALLPPVRALADRLGINRNTVVSAYRQLAQAGLVVTGGRAGTRVTAVSRVPQDGYAADSVLRDVGAGNPDPAFIPDLTEALAGLAGRPVLYGEPVIDGGLEAWARQWMATDVRGDFRLTITGGAFDAVERLLAQALTRDDAVALEDPCFLASIRTVRLAGYRPVAVAVDDEGMTVAGLREALAQGVRAVLCTPRAQNPTGTSLTERRAAELRAVLADHPFVLVIEDDHFSMLSRQPYRSIIGPGHRRWALVRSVSKFLGPDMSLAVTATDPETAERLAMRLSPGTTWVSHLLQRLTHALLTQDRALETIARAAAHYAERNEAFVTRLARCGIDAPVPDGLSLWVPVQADARAVSEQLMRRGWLARTGDEFAVEPQSPSRHLRLTVHHLDDQLADALASDLADASASAASST
ncbi:aminotransferase class I/II-fold pyridoxal phosphate-dependent enzyme [Tessaracoccus sp. OS52]|uniref:aminotransferase class I/II-fold pyridoxal phosphate-dependent enzyme n=1 Tax=Tessaracoccus sp. OS52 TaxID=2886691 RepID=UPI001D0FA6C5|nr:aminotransferase class I/II-fold pyridoxal phosphate-dependent enzyme [Tessaracoccus sp. OS52]MCC2594507.1 aminotransferase class I/II-fold pyridoxal phosphate-dependent enzyme [Tessaracoccus sp. OS52]